MARLTDQERVLNELRKAHGGTSHTEDHINYKRVGCKVAGKSLIGMGDTWEQAVSDLKAKVTECVSA
jgi:hypothetical protein